MQKTKFVAGINSNDEIYVIEISPKTEDHRYFSICGETLIPLKYDNAVSRSRESLEDGELWRQAVEANNTTQGLEDWIEEVLSIDGETSMIDNSLYPEEVEIDGINYLFESGSCGQHQEAPEDIKQFFIDKTLYNKIMKAWNDQHLKEENPENLEEILDLLPNNESLDDDIKKALEIIIA